MRRIRAVLTGFLLVVLASSPASAAPTKAKPNLPALQAKGEPIPQLPTGSSKALGAVWAALSQLGVPYVWGGASPQQGFDCSGLTMWAYQQVGINLPHYGGDQWNAGVHVSRADLQPGDLVFFYSDIHHMGMYIGDGKLVHAPHTGAVVQISDLSSRPFAGAVRVTE